MIIWVVAGLLGLATGVRIGWALVNKQSLVSTAMIIALGSLAVVAALNWQPLTLLLDTLLHWPNISVALSQCALIASAAGSCVMITTVASERSPVMVRRIAVLQYAFAAVIMAIALVAFFAVGRQPEMASQEYLERNLDTPTISFPWLIPLLYVLLALSLVSWAGLRHSNRSRRGRALFVFTLGFVLILLASAFFLIRAIGNARLLDVGTAATILGCAMAIVAAGALLPTLEDWFGARQEIRLIEPILTELMGRQPDIGIGVRPRGPLAFQIAEKLSLISDALFLEASAAHAATRTEPARTLAVDGYDDGCTDGCTDGCDVTEDDTAEHGDHDADEQEPLEVSPEEQARAIARWIRSGRGEDRAAGYRAFPGLRWLRQPETYSDREWIIEIARQYGALAR